MSFAAPNRRLYVGRIAPNASRMDVEDHFATMGPKPVDVKVLNGYGFIEYDSIDEAEDAIKEFDGRDFMGDRLLVQFAKASADRGPRRFDDRDGGRGGGDRGDSYRAGGTREKPNQGWRLQITNLPPGCSWQDLKDFARTAGSVHYAEVSRQDSSEGIIEYMSHSDAETAIKTLDGVDMRGSVVRITEHTAPAGQTWAAPRASPPRRDRDDDRDRRSSRRERSRSRSPGYRRGGDDRDRRGGDDRDRRGGSSRYERDDDRRGSGGGGDRDRDSSRRERSRSPRYSRDRSPRY